MPASDASTNSRDIAVGIEDIEPDHWVAWVFAIPGCFSSGPTELEALAGVPQAVLAERATVKPGNVVVRERWRATPAEDDPDFLVNALFDDDRRPLSDEEVRDGIARLERNRQILEDVLRGHRISEEAIGILDHMARAEHWYLGALGVRPPEDQPPAEPVERLRWVRQNLLRSLPRVAARDPYGDTSGEGWTARKLLRRTIWHERDHTVQIEQVLARA